ncbi:helix-turn-helix domain-containing protein [Streptomyces sp. NPDC048106]|uniref:helix-turn-helix domain-containing protein n=1 Tax=Streptomyces sp. NPDC048106 TaxID=3155750 RepID=UPI00345676D1
MRMEAGERFAAGASNGEIAKESRVGVCSVQRWRRAWQEAGSEALRSAGPVSRPKLSDTLFGVLEVELAKVLEQERHRLRPDRISVPAPDARARLRTRGCHLRLHAGRLSGRGACPRVCLHTLDRAAAAVRAPDSPRPPSWPRAVPHTDDGRRMRQEGATGRRGGRNHLRNVVAAHGAVVIAAMAQGHNAAGAGDRPRVRLTAWQVSGATRIGPWWARR